MKNILIYLLLLSPLLAFGQSNKRKVAAAASGVGTGGNPILYSVTQADTARWGEDISNWTLSGNHIYNNNAENVTVGNSSPNANYDLAVDNYLLVDGGVDESGARLEIKADGTSTDFGRIVSNGNTNATNALNVQNSDEEDIITIRDDKRILVTGGIEYQTYNNHFGGRGNRMEKIIGAASFNSEPVNQANYRLHIVTNLTTLTSQTGAILDVIGSFDNESVGVFFHVLGHYYNATTLSQSVDVSGTSGVTASWYINSSGFFTLRINLNNPISSNGSRYLSCIVDTIATGKTINAPEITNIVLSNSNL